MLMLCLLTYLAVSNMHGYLATDCISNSKNCN